MNESRAGLRLGIFVAAAAAGLTGLGIFLAGAPNVFSNRAKYVLVFPEAPGVSPGIPVRKSGVRIGEVSSMELDENTGQVRVHIVVEKKFLPRKGDEPTISRGLLNGDTAIDFVPKVDTPGLDRTAPIDPDSEIPGIPPFNTRILLNQAQGVLPNAQESLVQIVTSFRRFEQVAPKLEKTLDEFASLARSGREAIPEFRKTNEKLQDIIGVNDQDPPNVKALIQDLRETIKAFKPVAEDVQKLVKDNKDDVQATIKSLKTTSERINDLLSDDNRKNTAGLLKNLNVASDDLTKTVKLSAIFLDSADQTLKELKARLIQAEKSLKNVESATAPFAEGSAEIIKNINTAADQLAKTLIDVRETIRVMNKPDGTLQRVLGDPALYNNLNDAAQGLAKTLLRAEKIARDLEVFADKIARRPELIGIGGALRPNTGLKESPYAPTPQPVQQAPLAPIAPVPFGSTSYKPATWNGLLEAPLVPKR